MACPKCKCRVCYPYDTDPDMVGIVDEELQRCSNCGYVFFSDEELDDEEIYDEDGAV